MKEAAAGVFGTYERWAEAQRAVVEFERVIFRDGHRLTARELSRLQELRAAAEACLSQVIEGIDSEQARLHTRPEAPEGRPSA